MWTTSFYYSLYITIDQHYHTLLIHVTAIFVVDYTTIFKHLWQSVKRLCCHRLESLRPTYLTMFFCYSGSSITTAVTTANMRTRNNTRRRLVWGGPWRWGSCRRYLQRGLCTARESRSDKMNSLFLFQASGPHPYALDCCECKWICSKKAKQIPQVKASSGVYISFLKCNVWS